MAVKLRPLSDRVVILPDPPEKLTAGGLHVPDTARYTPQIGTVVAAGPGYVSDVPLMRNYGPAQGEHPTFPRRSMVVQEGDRVFFPKNVGTILNIGRETYIVVRETDIVAFVVSDETVD